MKRASLRQAGFTIVETMFFLAITGALLVIAFTFFNGRIGRTQFTQSVQEFDNQLKTTINEVMAGNYPSTQPINCTLNASGAPVVTAAAGGSTQGENTDCIFLGKVVQPGVAGSDGCSSSALQNCSNLNIYTVVGRRVRDGGQEVMTMNGANGARPRMVDGIGAGSEVNLTASEELGFGLAAYKIKNLSTGSDAGAVAILQTLASYNSGGGTPQLNSGAQSVQTWTLATAFPRTQQQIDNALAASNSSALSQANANPSILFCLQSGTSDQKASIALGLDDGRVATNVSIGEDSRCV